MTKKFRTFITGNNEFIKRNFNEFEFLKINNVGIFKKDCNLPLLINGNLSNQKSEFEVNNTIEKNSMLFYAIDNKKNIIIKESNFKDEYLESIMKYYGICIKENKFEDKNFLTREIKKCKNIFVESIDKLDSKEFFVPSDLKEAIYTIFIGIILDKKNFIIKNVSLSENNDTIIKILIECGIDIEFENQKVVNNLKICDLYVKNYNFKEFSVSKCRLESIIDLYPLLVFINILNKNKFKLYNFKEIKNKEKNNSDFLYNIMSNANVIITEYRDFVEFDATLANFEKIQKINIESNANIKIVLPLILFNIVKNNLNDNYFDYNYEINNIFPNFEHVLREFK